MLPNKARAKLRGELPPSLMFGCGGDRDRTKRPLMGEEAANRSDWVIATSDNPRSEDPQAIIDEIRVAVPAAAVDGLPPPPSGLDARVPADAAGRPPLPAPAER